jgi:uncharacterized membrane protein
MEPDLYAALDQRLRRVETEAAALRTELSRVAATVVAPVAPVGPVGPPSAVSRQAAARPVSLEGLFAGRGLQIAGLFLVLLGTAFFLNLAFTRGWIGPVERILLGLAAGVALVAEGIRRYRPGQVPVAEGLIGLGSGVLYLSLWASVAVFPELHVPRAAAFVAMVAVTSVLAVFAATRRAERVALLGLIGGFLTPLLMSSDTPERVLLAGYLFVLALGFGALGVRARYRAVEVAAFVASALYLPVFAPAHGWSVAEAAVVVTVLCALFAVAFAVGAVRDGQASALRLALLSVDAFAYAAMLGWIFSYRDTDLGIAFVALAAVFLLAARFAPVPRAMTAAYGYLGLSAATLALPALLHRMTLLDAFALEGAVLIALGARRGDRYVTVAGGAVLGLASVWLVFWSLVTPPRGTALSDLALAFAITAAALVYARGELALRKRDASEQHDPWTSVAVVAVNVVGVAGISRVLLDALGGPSWDAAVPSHAQFAVSFAWTAYATALFGTGMRRSAALLRRLGLGLFALTIFKVFTVDLGNVDVTWRIASFVVLGVVCLGVSAWYMRAQAAGREAQA